jgi:hypothetical protein
MGFNAVLFVLIQFVAEPWKRGRLLKSMMEKERELLEPLEAREKRYQETADRVDARLERVDARLDAVDGKLDKVGPSAKGPATDKAGPQLTWTDPRFWTHSFRWFYQLLRTEARVLDCVSIGLNGIVIWLLWRIYTGMPSSAM